GIRRRRPLSLRPVLCVSPDSVVTAVISPLAKLFVNPDQRQPLAGRLGLVGSENAIELIPPGADLRHRLMLALITELRRVGAQHLADHFPRDPQLAADLLDRLPLDQRQPAYLRNCLHNQHPKQMPPIKPEAV